jgi:hypothetical protein
MIGKDHSLLIAEFSENMFHLMAIINDITRRNVNEAADCSQLNF